MIFYIMLNITITSMNVYQEKNEIEHTLLGS